ncbi:S10 family peptidase [Sphingomonas sp. TDK1]|uniref:S10 family peptidase n=1 Tax=Sphingomonas sp. TDK1 TaxID=453247 RepID=UPI0007DA355B|nr:peptidase S10 [Sphingomonas sp. TDK1]OAN67208.1 peptidase S10 [Sphingomonas sp. TDK1]
MPGDNILRRSTLIAASVAALLLAPQAPAQDKKADTAEAKSESNADKSDLPPLPDDKTISQSAVIGGKAIRYQATVGKLPVYDDKGKKIGEVVYTAYVVPGGGAQRPVTFAFNGGPGAASVYLNLGAVGPKRVQFGDKGDAPSDAPLLVDNPSSWLDMTDLVFIDPVGTGFSRSLVDADATKKAFYATEPDVKYLSRIVYDWLVKNERLRSPKFVMGESYGGYRAPRIAYELQTQLGVGINGIVMVSPYLDPAATAGSDALSPLPWMITLPSMAAGHFEREGKLTPQAMAGVEAYTRGGFATDLLAGRSDPQATARLSGKVAELTGLDPKLVGRLDGRIDEGTYLREVHRDDGRIGSVYDSNVDAFDPFPNAAERKSGDPILEGIIAPTTSAMVDFITREVGWKTTARYNALSFSVNSAWDRGTPDDAPVSDLRKAVANDPKMGVLIVHGYNDLSCPYFGSRLIIDQMPRFGVEQRVKLGVYPGGHMFYSRKASAEAFKADARALYVR